MTECWQAGELRAYLDEELPSADMARVAAHLEACGECKQLAAHLEQRSQWVASRLEALAAAAASAPHSAKEARWFSGNRLLGGAIGLAASVVLALVLIPKGQEKRAAPAAPPLVAAPAAPAAQPPVTVKPAIIRRVLPRKKAAPAVTKPQLEYFLALDDEPVEAGVVVRVALENGRVPADVILGSDGRAHAIRLVSSVAGEK